MKHRPLIMAAAAAAALASAPSFAAEQSVRVEYKDLDLSSAKGQQILERRIAAAARKVCRVNEVRTGTILPPAEGRKCYKQALDDINQQLAMLVDKARKGG